MELSSSTFKFKIYYSQLLGRGAFGEVFKASWEGVACAAKVLHGSTQEAECALHGREFSSQGVAENAEIGSLGVTENALHGREIKSQGVAENADKVLHGRERQDPGVAPRVAGRFLLECQLMREVRHPCIIQCLGIAQGPEPGQLVILMELATENLTRFLPRCSSLSWRAQVCISQAIAHALAYLHCRHILHRDLSSSNVLMAAGNIPKVSDFGTATVLDPSRPHPLTPTPGTVEYMPPEAVSYGFPVSYTHQLDVFSLGVLMVQICTKKYPRPGPSLRQVSTEPPDTDTELPDTEPPDTLWERVPEAERRKAHIMFIDSNHPLLPLAMDCLRDDATERPTADQLSQRIKSTADQLSQS